MNYFAHGRGAMHDPYLLAGTAVPDWLGVADRRIRVPPKVAELWTEVDDPVISSLARGICRHHADDAWFHVTPAFGRLCGSFREKIESQAGGINRHVAGIVGHIAVELLLDGWLIEQDSKSLDRYFAAIGEVDGDRVAEVVALMTGKQPRQLSQFIGLFLDHAFLRDYVDDSLVFYRLSQILKRAGLGALPECVRPLLPWMRRSVYAEIDGLLSPSTDHDGSSVRD